MGTIADKLQDSRTVFGTTYKVCVYGLTKEMITPSRTSYGDENACNYGIAVGALGLVFAIALIIGIVVTDNQHLGSDTLARVFPTVGVGVSTLMSILWFVGFIYLTVKWRETESEFADSVFSDSTTSAANASLAFSFFATGTWIGLTVLAVLRLRQPFSSEPSAV
jgi:ABC-type dipeptide/oligopeptide/nickel transport system permease component